MARVVFGWEVRAIVRMMSGMRVGMTLTGWNPRLGRLLWTVLAM